MLARLTTSNTPVWFLSFLLGATLVGCVVSGSLEHFKETGLDVASYDMGCPKDKLQVKEIALQTFGVEGCGKKAKYVNRPGGWSKE